MSEERLIRRTRSVARGVLRQPESHLEDINKRMQLIAALQTEISQRLENIETIKSEVEDLMKAAKMGSHEYMGLIAEFVVTKTNDSREISVEDVRKLLKKDADFYAVVKVQLGELRGFLSDREIDGISKITPGKATGTKFQVTQPKKKAGKK